MKQFHDAQFNCDQGLVFFLKREGAVPHECQERSVIYYRFIGNRFHIYFLSADLLLTYALSFLECPVSSQRCPALCEQSPAAEQSQKSSLCPRPCGKIDHGSLDAAGQP